MTTKQKLPEGWEKGQLMDICKIREESIEPVTLGETLVTLYSVPAFDETGKPEILRAKAIGSSKNIVRPGDVIFCKMNPRKNRVWKIDGFETNYGLSSSEFLPLIPSEVTVDFLFYLLKSPSFQKSAMKKAQAATKSRERINPSKVLEIDISYPLNIDDQIAIASELEHKMAEVEKMRQAALRQKEAISAMHGAVLGEVFPYNAGDKLPVGWRWATLGEISTKISKGTTPTTLGHNFVSSGIPFLRAEDVNGGAVDLSKVAFYISEQTHDLLSRSKLQPGDLLITIAGTLGRIGYIPNNAPSANCNQAVAFLRLNPDIVNLQYACFVCQNTAFFSSLVGLKVTGTISNLNLENITEAKIPLPLTLEQQTSVAMEIERKLSAMSKLQWMVNRQLEAIKALPGAYLRDVFEFADS
ncbi:MAG TPA: restriction endonuclease subunit S [Desulfobacteria bacterium]|nr:restriction endonuclease subunit S [Desulfobacteria bacterium]